MTITFETTPLTGMRPIIWAKIPPKIDVVGQVRRRKGSDLSKPLDAVLLQNGEITLFTSKNFDDVVKVTFTYPY